LLSVILLGIQSIIWKYYGEIALASILKFISQIDVLGSWLSVFLLWFTIIYRLNVCSVHGI